MTRVSARRWSIWLPGVGEVLTDVTLDLPAGSVTGLVGLAGSGTSALLASIAGALPDGSRARGGLQVCGSDIRDVDLALLGEASRLFDAGDIGPDGAPRRWDANVAPITLFDHPTEGLDRSARARLAAAARQAADAGSCVVWADHDLDILWEASDQIAEFDVGHLRFAGASEAWRPVTLPEPARMTLQRLDVTVGDDRLPPAPPHNRERVQPIHAWLDPSALGLTGERIDFRERETVGVWCADHRDARRIARELGDALAILEPQVVVDAPRHLDPVQRLHAIRDLAAAKQLTLLHSFDDDFLLQAATRVLVVVDDQVLGIVPPRAITSLLKRRGADVVPPRTEVGEALGLPAYLSVSDVVSALLRSAA